MLDVHRSEDIDSRLQQFEHVLIPLGVATPGDIGVGELVDQAQLRPASDDRLDVHLLEGGAAVVEAPPRGQTALFNNWEDAVECAKCGGSMVRTGSCYTCRDCGTNTGCS